MSYILGSLTLPNPKKFTREFIEMSAQNVLVNGTTLRRVQNRKEQFILEFVNLTRMQVNSILSEYELGLVRSFSVDEGALVVSSTDVLIDISNREYPPSADLYRENLSLILTEVK